VEAPGHERRTQDAVAESIAITGFGG